MFVSYTYIADNVTRGCNIVFSELRGRVSQETAEILVADFIEDDVEKVMFQFSNDKAMVGMYLQNEFLKNHVQELK